MKVAVNVKQPAAWGKRTAPLDSICDFTHLKHMLALILCVAILSLIVMPASAQEMPVTFTDVSDALDFTHRSTEFGGNGLSGAAWFDFNEDRLVDLFIAGNTTTFIQPNKLYLNKGDFVFENISPGAGLHLTQSSCASICSDYDNDGDTDLFVTNYASGTALPHALYHNDGNGSFTDQAFFVGVGKLEFGWGCSFQDFDNDGWDDLFFTGALDTYCLPGTTGCPDFETIGDGRGNRGTVLFNRGDGTFANFSDQMPVDMRNLYTSGVAHADFDQNGFSDILVVAEATPAQHGRPATSGHPILYQNNGNGNNFVTTRLRGTSSNRDAIGARVLVHAGDLVQMKEVYAGSSHLSTSSAWLNFGLGKATKIDKVVVNWPSGWIDVWTDAAIAVNQTNVLVEGASPVAAENETDLPRKLVLHSAHPNPFSASTTVTFELPETAEVSLDLYDTIGRRVRTLAHGLFSTGRHSILIHPDGLTDGLYIYRLEANGNEVTGKLLLLR